MRFKLIGHAKGTSKTAVGVYTFLEKKLKYASYIISIRTRVQYIHFFFTTTLTQNQEPCIARYRSLDAASPSIFG